MIKTYQRAQVVLQKHKTTFPSFAFKSIPSTTYIKEKPQISLIDQLNSCDKISFSFTDKFKLEENKKREKNVLKRQKKKVKIVRKKQLQELISIFQLGQHLTQEIYQDCGYHFASASQQLSELCCFQEPQQVEPKVVKKVNSQKLQEQEKKLDEFSYGENYYDYDYQQNEIPEMEKFHQQFQENPEIQPNMIEKLMKDQGISEQQANDLLQESEFQYDKAVKSCEDQYQEQVEIQYRQSIQIEEEKVIKIQRQETEQKEKQEILRKKIEDAKLSISSITEPLKDFLTFNFRIQSKKYSRKFLLSDQIQLVFDFVRSIEEIDYDQTDDLDKNFDLKRVWIKPVISLQDRCQETIESVFPDSQNETLQFEFVEN